MKNVCRVKALAVATSLVALGVSAPAQVSAQARWTLTPFLSLSERFDDNILSTADDRISDFITEITPGFSLTLDQPTLTLSAGYSITGQLYADNSTLNNFGDNQSAFVSASYQASPRLRLGANGYYARTSEISTFLRPPTVPEGVTVTTLPTVETRRGRISNQGTANMSGEYQFAKTTSGTASYAFAATDNVTTSETLDTSHAVGLGITRQLTAVDQGSVTGTVGVFDTDEVTASYSALLGWARQWTPSLSSSLAAGPQVTDGHWNPAGTLDIRYRVERQLTVSLLLSQGTSLVVGGADPESATTLTGTVSYQASRALQLGGFGYVQRTAPLEDLGSNEATTNYAVGVSASYQITTWMTTYLKYQFTHEEGGVGTDGDIRNHQVILGLTFSYPIVF